MNALYLAPGTLADHDPLAFVDAAGRAGYSGVGLRLQKSPHLPIHPIVGDAALIRDVKHALAAHELRVLDILAFYLLPDTDVASFEPALALAGQLGARYALTQANDPDRTRLVDRLSAFTDLARGYDIVPIIEFVPDRVVATVADAMRLLDDAGLADVPILIDPLHLVRSGGTAADVRALPASRVPYAQMSDGLLAPGEPNLALAKRLGLGTRRMPGDGVLPLHDIVAALPTGIPLSIEVIMERPRDKSGVEWARVARERTEALLAAVQSPQTAPAAL